MDEEVNGIDGSGFQPPGGISGMALPFQVQEPAGSGGTGLRIMRHGPAAGSMVKDPALEKSPSEGMVEVDIGAWLAHH